MPSQRSFQLRSRDDGATLALSALDTDHLMATLKGASIDLARTVWVYRPLGLAEFFQDLASHWKGWRGPRTWASIEGELELSVEHSRVGHIHVTVRLRNEMAPPWRAEVLLLLEAGQLETLAADAKAFEDALPRAA